MSKFHGHSSTLCGFVYIKRGWRIQALVYTSLRAVIPSDYVVCDFVFIENAVEIGELVAIKSDTQIWSSFEI